MSPFHFPVGAYTPMRVDVTSVGFPWFRVGLLMSLHVSDLGMSSSGFTSSQSMDVVFLASIVARCFWGSVRLWFPLGF